ncbi:MAG TPA: hypothetical protein DD381_05660 [Lentisphaeria bacterium]|nr:hypothetical protein [Lentisphaeria bacterium]
MAELIAFAMSNFTLTFVIVGLIISIVLILYKIKNISHKVVIEYLFSYFLLFSIGFSFIYNFIFHTFFAEMAAAFIGWANSPFQYEVGYASLGIGIAGLIAFKAGVGFRAATVIIPAFFQLGAAGGHIYQMVVAHNFAPGNAGIMFWSDLFLPAIGFILLFLQYKTQKESMHTKK